MFLKWREMKKMFMGLMMFGSLLIAGCANVAELAGYSTQTMNASAANNYTQFVNKAGKEGAVDTSSITAKRVQSIYQRLLPYAKKANKTGIEFNWKMVVIRSDELNAWAMPGGKMAMYTGLVDKLKLSDAEIAAIVGHEMTHALEEHGKKAYGQKMITSLAMELGGAVVVQKTGLDANTVNLSKDLLGKYGIDLPYSRQHEDEADRGGLFLMAEAGYDPRAAVSVWQKMSAFKSSGGVLAGLLSTHPTNENRMKELNKLLPEAMLVYERSSQAPLFSGRYVGVNGENKKRAKAKK